MKVNQTTTVLHTNNLTVYQLYTHYQTGSLVLFISCMGHRAIVLSTEICVYSCYLGTKFELAFLILDVIRFVV